MGEAFVHYFQQLFTAGTPTDMEPCLQNLEAKVTPTMNDGLLQAFLE
jgi:hypothetical protein